MKMLFPRYSVIIGAVRISRRDTELVEVYPRSLEVAVHA
jgi:hypothetical protein